MEMCFKLSCIICSQLHAYTCRLSSVSVCVRACICMYVLRHYYLKESVNNFY